MSKEKTLDLLHDLCNKLSVIIGLTMVVKKKTGAIVDATTAAELDSLVEVGWKAHQLIQEYREELRTTKCGCSEATTKMDVYKQFSPGGQIHAYLTQVCKEEMLVAVEFVNRVSKGCAVWIKPTALEAGKQFMNNVLYNAKKAHATSLRLVVIEHDAYVAFHIIDDGDGMSAETVSCLGLPIASSTSTGEGTRIAKKLALQECAVTEWSSPGLGAGACVTVRMTKCKTAA